MIRRLFICFFLLLVATPCAAVAQNTGATAMVSALFELEEGVLEYEIPPLFQSTFTIGDGSSSTMGSLPTGPLRLEAGESFEIFGFSDSFGFFDSTTDGSVIGGTFFSLLNEDSFSRDVSVNITVSAFVDSFGSSLDPIDSSASANFALFLESDLEPIPDLDIGLSSIAFLNEGLIEEERSFLLTENIAANSRLDYGATFDVFTNSFVSISVPEPNSLTALCFLSIAVLTRRRRK